MKKIIFALLSLLAFGPKAFSQGGNTCAAAQAAPITLNTAYPAQTTCGQINDYTGTASTCMTTTYYTAQDWFYYFCAPSDGCVTISMQNVTSGVNGQAAYPSISVFNGCPGTGTCVGGMYQIVAANATLVNGPNVQLNVLAGQCFYIVIDGYTNATYANCVNFTLNTTFTAPLAQTPGGNTCATAQANPITLGNSYPNQTTCCAGNDFTGTNSTCIGANYYNSQDWYYYFCSPVDACVTISLSNLTSGGVGQAAYASLSVLNGCPGTGTCVGGGFTYIAPNATVANGPSVQLNVTAGQCFYIVVDGYKTGTYADCFNFTLNTTTAPALVQTPGGNTCATAQSNPITIGQTYTGQTTCCAGNDYTGTNSTCIGANYYNGSDWFYYFCAQQTGCVTISMPNTTSGSPGQPAYPSLSVFTGCPGTGTCITGSYLYVAANATVNGPSVNFQVIAGQCYYVVVDSYVTGTYSNCVNYNLTSTFSPPLAQTPGGDNCATAMANPLTLGQTYNNQSTCCGGNTYTGTNGCLAANYYNANNWFYYVCANQTGYLQVTLSNITATSAAYPSLSVFTACPGTANACVAANYQYVAANATGTLTVTFQAAANQCYFIVVDGYQTGTYANCINYNIATSLTPVPQNPTCVNMDFETGNLTGWFATSGTALAGPTGPPLAPTPTYNMTGLGAIPGRHDVVGPTGVDPCGGFPVVFSGNYSMKLGNNLTGAQAEQISQTFMVTPANSSFSYSYAVVFQDPNHQSNQQPFFKALMKDQNGNIINCSQFIVAAGVNLPGFFNSTTCSTVRYKPWSTVNVDLTPYLNQYVTIEFTNGDCSASGHYGYAYIDAQCGPSLLAANNDTICFGASTTLTAPIGYAGYNWNPGNFTTTSITVSPTTTTVYTLTLTGFNQCITTHYDTVWVMPNPTANFTFSNPLCNMPINFTSTSTVNNPSTITNYAWTFNGGNPANSNAQNPNGVQWSNAGNYSATLTVTTDAGCTASFTASVVIPPCVVNVQTTGDTLCLGGCASLTATPSSGIPPYTYSWSPNIGNGPGPHNVCPTSTTSYIVTITDSIGNVGTDTAIVVIIPPLTINFTPNNPGCFGGSNGSATANPASGFAPYTYSWNNGQTTQTATGLSAGTYTVNVTDNFGCTGSATVTLSDPPLLTTQAAGFPALCANQCNGQAVTIPAGGTQPFSFSWAPTGGTAASATGLCAGTYTVTITDANGCTVTDTAIVTQPPPIAAQISSVDSSGCGPFCTDFSDISPDAATSWNWSFPGAIPASSTQQNPSNICYPIAGLYDVTITITNSNGCTATIVVPQMIDVWPNPVPAFTATPQVVTLLNPTVCFTNQSQGGVTYNWDFGNPQDANNTSTAFAPCHTYTDTGTYCVELIVTNADGCRDSITHCVIVRPDFVIWVPNAFTPNGDGNNDFFFPKGYGLDESTYKLWIYDRWGNMIFTTTNWNEHWNGKANGGSDIAQEDVYVWKIVVNDVFGKKHSLVGHVSLIR
jgi:gliding motility-associated-like protein